MCSQVLGDQRDDALEILQIGEGDDYLALVQLVVPETAKSRASVAISTNGRSSPSVLSGAWVWTRLPQAPGAATVSWSLHALTNAVVSAKVDTKAILCSLVRMVNLRRGN